MAKFPTDEWLQALIDKLNSDEQYARIAQKWEGDMVVSIEPEGPLKTQKVFYLDLWHGTCRDGYVLDKVDDKEPALFLSAPYHTFVKILKGDLQVLQALLTRKIHLKGNMALLMRNVPTVLDFVRCASEVTDSYLE